jgi:hypothetical protein
MMNNMTTLVNLAKIYDTLKKPYTDSRMTEKVCTCDYCGFACSMVDLEIWACNFDTNDPDIICSLCYEDEMGEDL